MTGELDPIPLVDILGGVGYRTAMGEWPPGFDEAHALLTLVHLTEKMRRCIVAHHDAHPHLGPVDAEHPCLICMQAQGASPADVLTDLTVPDFPPDSMFVPAGDERCGEKTPFERCECARPKGHPGLHRCPHGEWS